MRLITTSTESPQRSLTSSSRSTSTAAASAPMSADVSASSTSATSAASAPSSPSRSSASSFFLYLSLDPATAKPWNDEAMRDVREIGHYGMGDVEYSLRRAENVDETRQLIKLAYDGATAR